MDEKQRNAASDYVTDEMLKTNEGFGLSVDDMIDLTKLPDTLGILKDFNDRFPGFFDEE